MMATKVTVIGGGTMGSGIAQVCAQNGIKVSIFDVSREALTAAMEEISRNLDRQIRKHSIDADSRDRILSYVDPIAVLEQAINESDVIIEAIPEKRELKLGMEKL